MPNPDTNVGKLFRSKWPEFAEAEFKVIELVPEIAFARSLGGKQPAYLIERVGHFTHSHCPVKEFANRFDLIPAPAP